MKPNFKITAVLLCLAFLTNISSAKQIKPTDPTEITQFVKSGDPYTINFKRITNNGNNEGIGERQFLAQLFMVEGNAEVALLRFSNNNPVNSSAFEAIISEIYIDDSKYLSSVNTVIDTQAEVAFHAGAKPSNLPAGNELTKPFSANACLSLEADNPEPKNGLGLGKWVEAAYDIGRDENGQLYSIAQIVSAIETSEIKFGLHAKSFAGNGASESFINSVAFDNSVPEPATIGLLGIGALAIIRKRRNRS